MLILSEAILAELRLVFARPKIVGRYQVTPERAKAFLEVLRETALIVPGAVRVQAVPGDAKDDHVVACAVEGGAGVIVSGDAHLLSLGQYQSIRIVSPAHFLRFLEEALKQNE